MTICDNLYDLEWCKNEKDGKFDLRVKIQKNENNSHLKNFDLLRDREH